MHTMSYYSSHNTINNKKTRHSCPKCGTNNTYVETQQPDGSVLFHCFRASCGYSGKRMPDTSIGIPLDTISGMLNSSGSSEIYSGKVWYNSGVDNLRLIQNDSYWFHMLPSAIFNPPYSRYDLYEDMRTGKLAIPHYNYVGDVLNILYRKRDGELGPKWTWHNREHTDLFKLYNKHLRTDRLVIVEDCISAAHVARTLNDDLNKPAHVMSWNGKVIRGGMETYARYGEIHLMLDPDVSTPEIISIRTRLQYLNNCAYIFYHTLPHDPKYLSESQLKDYINTNVHKGTHEHGIRRSDEVYTTIRPPLIPF